MAYEAGRIPILPGILVQKRTGEPFNPQVHVVLRHSLHPDSEAIYSRNQRITRGGEARTVRSPNPGEAGATPHIAAQRVTDVSGSLPPHCCCCGRLCPNFWTSNFFALSATLFSF